MIEICPILNWEMGAYYIMMGRDGMRKRILVLSTIICMCAIVIIGGAVTFLESDSVLKMGRQVALIENPRDLRIFIDLTENKMYLISEGSVIKSYRIASGKYNTPSPIGDWIITSKATWGEGFGGRWMGLNVPWGRYGIHGTENPGSIGGAVSHGCIRMKNEDANELYRIARYGTPVKIYGGPFGSFGMGFRVLKPGDRGADVYEVQKRLKQKGYFNGYVSGIYDETTKKAVHNFQEKNNIYITNNIGYSFYNKLGIILFE